MPANSLVFPERCLADHRRVPAGADMVWRQRSMEEWIQRVLRYQADGLDVLLTGQWITDARARRGAGRPGLDGRQGRGAPPTGSRTRS